jgi:hypothetical protein
MPVDDDHAALEAVKTFTKSRLVKEEHSLAVCYAAIVLLVADQSRPESPPASSIKHWAAGVADRSPTG